MDKIIIDQKLLLILKKNNIIKSTTDFNYYEQAIISLIRTLISMGYNNNDILDLVNEKMSLLEILEFHQDLVVSKHYECCCLINKLKKKIKEIKEKNNGIYN